MCKQCEHHSFDSYRLHWEQSTHKNYSFRLAVYGVCIVVLCVMGSIQRRWDLRKTYWFTLLVSLLIENWTVTIVCWCFMHKLKPLFHFQNIQKLPLSHANGIFTNAHILISYSYSKTKWMCVVILISDLPPTESCSIYHSSGFYLSIVLCVVILVAVFFYFVLFPTYIILHLIAFSGHCLHSLYLLFSKENYFAL